MSSDPELHPPLPSPSAGGEQYTVRKCRGHWHVTLCGEDIAVGVDGKLTEAEAHTEAMRLNAECVAPARDGEGGERGPNACPSVSAEGVPCYKLRDHGGDHAGQPRTRGMSVGVKYWMDSVPVPEDRREPTGVRRVKGWADVKPDDHLGGHTFGAEDRREEGGRIETRLADASDLRLAAHHLTSDWVCYPGPAERLLNLADRMDASLPVAEAVDRGEELAEFAGKLHGFAKPWLKRDEYLAWYLTESERLLRAAAARLTALEGEQEGWRWAKETNGHLSREKNALTSRVQAWVSNLAEALGESRPTAEETIGAAIAAIHQAKSAARAGEALETIAANPMRYGGASAIAAEALTSLRSGGGA